MISPGLMTPLRIPELGPSLGQLVTGTELRHVGLTLDEFRYQLVTRMMEHAGEARRLAAGGERKAAVQALGKTAWLTAWEQTVQSVATRVIDTIERRLIQEARAVRMPARLRKRVSMSDVERRALTARLGATGAGLIPALSVIERRSALAVDPAGNDGGEVRAWQEALQQAARRLEAGWLALEQAVDREIEYWQTVADTLAAWRKPLWPVVVFGAVGTALATWLGLMLGGFVPVPVALGPWVERLSSLLP